MELNRATIEEFESIIAFYDDVTDRTPEMELYARWQKGKHPTHDGIRAYIEEGSMYLYKARLPCSSEAESTSAVEGPPSVLKRS